MRMSSGCLQKGVKLTVPPKKVASPTKRGYSRDCVTVVTGKMLVF